MLNRLHLARLPWPRPDPRGDEQLETDLADELEFHLERRRREYEREGLDSAAARRAAALRFGDVQRIKAQCRRIARKERIMLQKINLVLMIVVLMAVVGVSVQMYVTQRYNTLAIQAMSAQLAEQAVEGKAAERSTGTVFVDGKVRRPGVYDIPADGLTMRRLLVVAGHRNQHANATVHRRIDDEAEETYTVEVLADGTIRGDDLVLRGGDLVVFSEISDASHSYDSGRTSSATNQDIAGLWQQVDDAGHVIDAGMRIEILSRADIRNLQGDPAGNIVVPGLAYEIRVVFRWNRMPNLEIHDCFEGPNYLAHGRWLLDNEHLVLNLAPAPGSRPEHEHVRFARVNNQQVLDTLADEQAKVTALTDFIIQMMTVADPRAIGSELTVQSVLDAAAGKLDEQVVNDPEIEAQIREAIDAAKRRKDDPKEGG